MAGGEGRTGLSAFGDAFGGVFFLFGEDEFSKRQTARLLVERHVDPSTRDFNLDILDGVELEVDGLASILATPPMMAEWRVVQVRNMEALANSSKARELLLQICESPPPGLALILTASIPSGSKAKIYRDLRTQARSVEFPAVSLDDAPGWLMRRVRDQHGLEMDEVAARALATAVGADLGILAQELEKLVQAAEDSDSISLDDVRRVAVNLPQVDRWHWFDLVGERHFDQALSDLTVLLGQNESGVGLTSGLTTHLLRLGVALEQGGPGLEAVLPTHQKWLSRKLMAQSRHWEFSEVQRALQGLRRVDRLLKSGPFSDSHLLEEWIMSLMVGARNRLTA